jgi:hypothetical protein
MIRVKDTKRRYIQEWKKQNRKRDGKGDKVEMTIIRILNFILLIKNGLTILRKRKSAGNPACRIINTTSEKS